MGPLPALPAGPLQPPTLLRPPGRLAPGFDRLYGGYWVGADGVVRRRESCLVLVRRAAASTRSTRATDEPTTPAARKLWRKQSRAATKSINPAEPTRIAVMLRMTLTGFHLHKGISWRMQPQRALPDSASVWSVGKANGHETSEGPNFGSYRVLTVFVHFVAPFKDWVSCASWLASLSWFSFRCWLASSIWNSCA